MKYAWYNYHNKGGKKNAAKYYGVNIEVLREDARNMYRNLWEKEKEKTRGYRRNRYHMNIYLNERLKQYQRDYFPSKRIKKKLLLFCIVKEEWQVFKI